MKDMHRMAAAVALLVGVGCSDGRAVLDPTAPEVALRGAAPGPTAFAGRTPASGEFDAIVDFSTLTLTPRGRNCLLEVDGQLVFSGTIEGAATGTTRALVFATCAEVSMNPPGTFRDVFRSELEFEGSVDGEAAGARMIYQGRVQEGGGIDGRVLLSNGMAGVLEVEAQVAVGGSYSGSVVVR